MKMERLMRMVAEQEGEVDVSDVEAALGEVFAELGAVEGASVDDVAGTISFSVVGDSWRATIMVDGDGGGKATLYDTEAADTPEIDMAEFGEATPEDAIGAAYDWLDGQVGEE